MFILKQCCGSGSGIRIRIRIGLQRQTLDPDPDPDPEKINTDPQHCIKEFNDRSEAK